MLLRKNEREIDYESTINRVYGVRSAENGDHDNNSSNNKNNNRNESNFDDDIGHDNSNDNNNNTQYIMILQQVAE